MHRRDQALENKKTSAWDNGLIWFGAGVSLAEILTGTFLAPLGLKTGILAILLGHLIGGILFYLTGIISANSGKSAMEAVKMTYGKYGGKLFAILNVFQLVGWTAIMIYDGAISANSIWSVGQWIWCMVIGGLIIVWILIGITDLGKINTVTMAALFVLTIVLCAAIVRQGSEPAETVKTISFGAALELSVSMPLSWLPVIGDYTSRAREPVRSTFVSTIAYTLVSCWMFLIGMGAAIFAGSSDITQIMLKASLGVAGLLIIVFSTVTTTFLDAFSAGISAESVCEKLSGKAMAIAASIFGTVCAFLFPMDDITAFLYLIGSVFAPMAAVLIGSCLLLKTNAKEKHYDWIHLLVWLVGFVIYRLLMKVDTPLGYTLPDILITLLLTIAANKIFKIRSMKMKHLPRKTEQTK